MRRHPENGLPLNAHKDCAWALPRWVMPYMRMHRENTFFHILRRMRWALCFCRVCDIQMTPWVHDIFRWLVEFVRYSDDFFSWCWRTSLCYSDDPFEFVMFTYGFVIFRGLFEFVIYPDESLRSWYIHMTPWVCDVLIRVCDIQMNP